MEIADHAITAFIGPSGCGKSTFLRCLNPVGDVVINGHGKRVGLLEYHADLFTKQCGIHPLIAKLAANKLRRE